MTSVKIIALLLTIATPGIAQTLPDKPQPRSFVRVKLVSDITGKTEVFKLPVPHPTVDHAFLIWSGVSQALTVADVANTRLCMSGPPQLQCREQNPIFGGPHPSASLQYGITEGVFAFTEWMAYRQKRQNDAERAFGARITASNHWWIWPAMNTAVHAFGLVFTIAETKR